MTIPRVIRIIDYLEAKIPYLSWQNRMVQINKELLLYINTSLAFSNQRLIYAQDELVSRIKDRWDFSFHIQEKDPISNKFKTLIFMRY